jgi:peptidoglycan/LPS O-acetylase OafA/YrhL
VLSGWLAALIGYEIVSRVHSGFDGKYFPFSPTAKFIPWHMQAAAPERAATSQFPGFDGLRLGAAVAVLHCHAFVIAESPKHPSGWLAGYSGDYGVYTFFIISGFLLQRSLSLNLDLIQFTINRTLRLLPGFLFCILITTFVFGPIVSILKTNEYFFQALTYEYVRESVKCLCETWQMPFALNTDPYLMYTKNASLWTLSYEVRCYLFLLLIWAVLRDKTVVVLFAVGGATVLLLVPSANKATWTFPILSCRLSVGC